jgi:hypothetical protein
MMAAPDLRFGACCCLQLQGKAVTCIFCKADARCVWTGHADGTILLHAEGKWGAAQYKTQVWGLRDRVDMSCSSLCVML